MKPHYLLTMCFLLMSCSRAEAEQQKNEITASAAGSVLLPWNQPQGPLRRPGGQDDPAMGPMSMACDQNKFYLSDWVGRRLLVYDHQGSLQASLAMDDYPTDILPGPPLRLLCPFGSRVMVEASGSFRQEYSIPDDFLFPLRFSRYAKEGVEVVGAFQESWSPSKGLVSGQAMGQGHRANIFSRQDKDGSNQWLFALEDAQGMAASVLAIPIHTNSLRLADSLDGLFLFVGDVLGKQHISREFHVCDARHMTCTLIAEVGRQQLTFARQAGICSADLMAMMEEEEEGLRVNFYSIRRLP